MHSIAKTVNDYLDEVPAERKAVVVRLRELCCGLLKGFEESMAYGGRVIRGMARWRLGLPARRISLGCISSGWTW